MRSLFLGIGILCSSFAFGQATTKKQEEVPKVLLVSRFAYVEALDGDIFNLHLLAEDRKAIMDVENALRTWNRYMITTKRREADVIFIVRKGRLVDVHGGTGGGAGGDPRGTSQPKPHDEVTASLGAEVGPADDLLYVYIVKPDGSLQGPVWKHYLKDGLDTPDIRLFKQLKDAVETASRQTPSKSATP
jgi:hypothetical protein